MKRGFFTCLLVFELVCAAYGVNDNLGSESQDSGNSINFRYIDKNKRGAAKITNTDSSSFNHLTTSNTATTGSANYKVSTSTSSPSVYKYLYNQQYYQPNPYVSYVQIPQAAQIATQYSFQSNPVAHFLQTPTQIQYVAAPTIAHLPQLKYQSVSAAISPASESTNSEYIAQSLQSIAAPSTNQVSAASSTSQSKQVQVPLQSGYQTAQPVYYTQQPAFTYFPQAQPANYIYQPPNSNYLFKQQQQIANIYGAHRFGLFHAPIQSAQLTYLVPMVVSHTEQDPTTTTTTTTTNLKSSDKTLSNTQQTPSGNSFTYGTKA